MGEEEWKNVHSVTVNKSIVFPNCFYSSRNTVSLLPCNIVFHVVYDVTMINDRMQNIMRRFVL